MHSIWHQFPFVRLLFPFCTGIIFSQFYAANLTEVLISLMVSAVISFFLYFSLFRLKQLYKPGIFTQLLYFLLGFWVSGIQLYFRQLNHFSKTNAVYLQVQIADNPYPAMQGWKCTGRVLAGIAPDSSYCPLQGKMLLFFTDSANSAPLHYGDCFWIKSHIPEISEPAILGQFNYALFMERQGIWHQQKLKRSQYLFRGENNGNGIMKSVYALQQKIRIILTAQLPGPADVGMAMALLYGYDKEMNRDDANAYRQTGTLHILAVSGMHVGLIAVLLEWILMPLFRRNPKHPAAAVIKVLFIWVYAILCGFSASILRAAVMFSFLLLGKHIRRRTHAINILAASAFFLLCTDTNLLYNAGFQLSYSAVLSILIFYKPLYMLFTFPYAWQDEIWKLLSVTLSAQVLTLPLTLALFHQFPTYFLPANLIIIPLSTLAIYLGLALIAFSSVAGLSYVLGKALGIIMHLCNLLANYIASLPGACIINIVWTPAHTVLYLLLLIVLYLYFSRRIFIYLKLVFALPSMFYLFLLGKEYINSQQQMLYIYASTKGNAVLWVDGNQPYFWFHTNWQQDKNILQKVCADHLLASGKPVLYKALPVEGNYFLSFGSNRTLFFWQEKNIPLNIQTDILLVGGKGFQDLETFLKHNKVGNVILSANLQQGKREALKALLVKRNISFYDLSEKPTFTLNTETWSH